jgi:hypothetical protein
MSDADKLKNDSMYRWRAHRLLMRKRLEFVVQEKRIIEDLSFAKPLIRGDKPASNETNS